MKWIDFPTETDDNENIYNRLRHLTSKGLIIYNVDGWYLTEKGRKLI